MTESARSGTEVDLDTVAPATVTGHDYLDSLAIAGITEAEADSFLDALRGGDANAADAPPTVWRAHMRLRHVNYGHGEISEVVEVDFEYDTVTVVSPEGVESEWKISDVREVSA